MSATDAVIARLHGQVAELAGRVEGALELAALVDGNNMPQQTPAAFVIPLGLRGGAANAVTGMYRQSVNETVAVVLVLDAPSDPAGESARPTLQTIIGKTINALAGFAPDAAIGVFELTRGDLVQCAEGLVIYQLDFTIADQLRIA